jgi:hypothetical protein
MTIGRPSKYSDELADIICERLMDGKSLREICRDDDAMPHRITVIRWMAADPAFATKCAYAREEQGDYMDDLILETANACTPETAAADRVKIAAYQWRAAKLRPKKYGDNSKHTLSGPDDGPIKVELTREEQGRALAFLLSEADKAE